MSKMSNHIVRQREMDNRHIDYDEWGYFEDPDSGVGIVINHFRDEGDPMLNVYVVPKDKVANNDWHNDMIDITGCESRIKRRVNNMSNKIIIFSKNTLWMNQAPCWNFELDEDELLAKALEVGFVKQVGEDRYEMNQDYEGKN